MEGSKSNEDSPNKSTLSDDEKPPSPKVILFEKHEVVRLENVKLKEKQESNIPPDLTKEQKEAVDGPPDLTEHHCLSKEDSTKYLLQGESKENICPGSNSALDLTKQQDEAADTKETKKHCPSQKNSMNSEFSNGKHPYKKGQEGNASADLIKEQTEANDIHTEESGPQLHIQKDSTKGGLPTEESSEGNGQGSNSSAELSKEQTEATEIHAEEPGPKLHIQKNSEGGELPNEENMGKTGNTPADLVKEQTEATDIHAEEPGPQLQIQNDPVKGEFPAEDSPEVSRQKIKDPADLKHQNEYTDSLHRIPKGNSRGLENNLKELPVTKSLENYLESNISNQDKDQAGYSYDNGLPKERGHALSAVLKELSVGEILKNDVVMDMWADLENVQFEADDVICQEQIIADNSKCLIPVDSLSAGSVSMKGIICMCTEQEKIKCPNVCPTKFRALREASIVSLSCFQPVLKDPLEGDIFNTKSSVETAAQFHDFYTDESEDETDYPPISLKGFSKEFFDELFSKLDTQDVSSDTDVPLSQQSPSSEDSRPILPVPNILENLNKEQEDHDVQCMQAAIVLRILELFKKYPDYPFGSPLKNERIPSQSSTDDSSAHEPLYLKSPSSEDSRPIFPVPTILANLNKEKEAHDVQSMQAEEVLRILELFKKYPDYPFGFPLKSSRIPSQSSTDDSSAHERLSLKSPSSEDSRPILPVPTILANLNKEQEDHDGQSMHAEEVLRVPELFKKYPDFSFGSPLKNVRIPSQSSSDNSSGYSRYVQLSPTDVVSLKKSHFGFLSSLKNEMKNHSSSIKRNDGPFVARFVRKCASSALETFATFAEGMEEKVKDDIQFYNDNYEN